MRANMLAVSETERLGEYYRPVGYLEGEGFDVTAGEKLVAESSLVEFEDIRKNCPGNLKDLQNADIGNTFGHDMGCYVNDVIFVGKLQNGGYVTNAAGDGYYELGFQVISVEAGYQDYIEAGETVRVRVLPGFEEYRGFETFYPTAQDEAFLAEYENLKPGGCYLLRAYYRENGGVNPKSSANSGNPGNCFVLDTLLPDGEKQYFYEVKEAGETDYEIAGLTDFISYLKNNQSAVEFVGTRDMSMMPFCQESERRYYLTDGRWIDSADDEKQNPVCVIHHYFAELRGLKVGDKISVVLRNTDEHVLGYAYRDSWDAQKTAETVEKEFEIVGVYDDVQTSQDFVTQYSQQIYIPSSCIPADYELADMLQTGGSQYYSFVLREAEDQEAFLEENKSALEELGLRAVFVENHAESFASAAAELKQSTAQSAGLLGVVLFFAEFLLCMLYTMQRRREFFVMRILGASKVRNAVQMTGAFWGLGFPGIVFGGVAGWKHTAAMAEEVLAPLMVSEAAKRNTGELSGFWPVGICAGIAALLFLFLLLGVIALERKPKISMLQEDGGRVKQKAAVIETQIKSEDVNGNTSDAGHMERKALPGTLKNRIKAGAGYVCRYHARTFGRSAFLLALGFGSVIVLGWINHVMSVNEAEKERLYRDTVVEGEIVKANSGMVYDAKGGGTIAPQTVAEIMQSGMVEELYAEETAMVSVYGGGSGSYSPDKAAEQNVVGSAENLDVPVLGIYAWDSFMEGTGKNIEVNFLIGYDGEVFCLEREEDDLYGSIVILPEELLLRMGVQIGDSVYMVTLDGKRSVSCRIVGSYLGSLSGSMSENTVIMPGGILHELVGEDYCYFVAKLTFDSEKNRELLESGEELEQMVFDAPNPVQQRLVIWDEELHQVLEPMERTLSLLRVIYPLTVFVLAVLNFGFQLLLLLQRAKEAAILRVLGNSILEVRILFIAGQAGVFLLGMLAGVWAVSVLDWQAQHGLPEALLLCCLGALTGIVSGGIADTNRPPLALLQVKE